MIPLSRITRWQGISQLIGLRPTALPTARESQTQAQWNLTTAERELRRNQELLAKGFISQSRVDESERQLEVAKSQLSSARSQVSAQGAQGAEAAQARSQLAELVPDHLAF